MTKGREITDHKQAEKLYIEKQILFFFHVSFYFKIV